MIPEPVCKDWQNTHTTENEGQNI